MFIGALPKLLDDVDINAVLNEAVVVRSCQGEAVETIQSYRKFTYGYIGR